MARFTTERLAPGALLGGYQVEALVSRGGMGVVYRAIDVRLQRPVALKLVSPDLAADEGFRERFLTESRLAASLDHSHVVPVYEAGDADGTLFLAMRFVEGDDLRTILRREGPIAPERALEIVSQLGKALDVAHTRGLVHRDVKPANVLVANEGGHEHCYLTDFGLSRGLGTETAAAAGIGLSGTLAYTAPELIAGEPADGRVDVYSLGCLLFECLTGHPPFSAKRASALLFAHLSDPPPKSSEERLGLPPAMDAVIASGLAKLPEERLATCHELVAQTEVALRPGARRRRRRLAALATLAALALAAATVIAVAEWGGNNPPAAPTTGDVLVRIDPERNEVAGRIPVGRKPSGVAVDDRYVWVINSSDGNVWRVDPRTKRHLAVSTNGSPTGVAAGGGLVAIANGPQRSIAVLDAKTGTVDFVSEIGPGNAVLRVAAGREGIWFADPSRRIAGTVDESLRGGAGPSLQADIPPDKTSFVSAYEAFDSLAVGEGAVWVAGDAFGRSVWRVDPRTGRVLATIPVPFIPNGIAAGEGAVWVTSLLGDAVSRIDPATDRLANTIGVGAGAGSVAVGGGSVWVANEIDGTVSRVDSRTNRVVATLPLGAAPVSIAADSSAVWVTTRSQQAAQASEHTIVIGILANCSGSFGQFGDVALAGAELAMLERGGRRAGPRLGDGVDGVSIGGQPIRVVYGCSDGTASSALVEARRLVENVGADVLIGPLRGEEGVALQEYARRKPAIAFVNGSSSTQLLNPAPNFFSFHIDGVQWMAGLGTYAYRTLGWRTAVTVASLSEDIFEWGQVAGFTAEFCALGGKVVKRLWNPPATSDFSAVVAEIPANHVDGILAATNAATVVALATGVPQLRGNISRKLLGGILLDFGLKPLGDRVRGLVRGGPDLNLHSEEFTRHARDFAKAFPRLRGFAGNVFEVFYFDAMAATLKALDEVDGDVSAGERRLMAALADVELDSAYGHVVLDSRHQAIGPNYLARRPGRSGLALKVFRAVPHVDRTFGGYFKPSDPPPSKSTPACRYGDPPPWAQR